MSRGRPDRLTAKELKFCQGLMKLETAQDAAIAVGYSPTTATDQAHRILKRPLVKEFMEQKIKQMEQEVGVTIKWKLDKLKKLVELSLPEDAYTHKDISVSGIISGISEMNKMQGHYSAEKTVNVNANVSEDVDVKLVIDHIEKYKREY